MIAFRIARLEDIDELLRLAGQLFNPLYSPELKRDELELLIKSDKSNHMVFVIDDGDKLLAFADIIVWKSWLSLVTKLYIHHLFVDESQRLKGIGTIIIRYLKAFSIDWILVDTVDRFPESDKFFTSLGFTLNPKRTWYELRVKH